MSKLVLFVPNSTVDTGSFRSVAFTKEHLERSTKIEETGDKSIGLKFTKDGTSYYMMGLPDVEVKHITEDMTVKEFYTLLGNTFDYSQYERETSVEINKNWFVGHLIITGHSLITTPGVQYHFQVTTDFIPGVGYNESITGTKGGVDMTQGELDYFYNSVGIPASSWADLADKMENIDTLITGFDNGLKITGGAITRMTEGNRTIRSIDVEVNESKLEVSLSGTLDGKVLILGQETGLSGPNGIGYGILG